MAWIRSKKLRITDFFRKQDKDGDGALSRAEFIEGMMTSSKFTRGSTMLCACVGVSLQLVFGLIVLWCFVCRISHQSY